MSNKAPLIKEPNPAGTGAPIIADEQYQKWLDLMQPFLRQGCSLRYAMEKCDLMTHEFSIREKYRSGDWFSRKVDALRATVGELINNVGFKVVEGINTKLVESNGKAELTRNEVQVWKTMAEKHRAAQTFFVNRTETAESKREDVGKILDIIEGGGDYEQLGSEATKQVVEAQQSVQGPEQSGPTGDVSPELHPDPAHGGQGEAPVQPNPQV